MNRAIWKKSISESTLLFVAIALGTASFAWFRVHVVGEIDTSSFERIIDMIPKDWLRFTAVDVPWMISYVGRTALALDEPFLVMMIAIWSIVRGSDVVSGEISRGTMEMLLAQPVSRTQAFVVHTIVTLLGVVALVLITWLAMGAGVYMTDVKIAETSPADAWRSVLGPAGLLMPAADPTFTNEPMADYVNPVVYWPGLVNLLMLGCFIAGLASLLSSVDRFRWRTLGIVIGLYMIAAMIKILGLSDEAFHWTSWFTFFSLYEPELSIKLYQSDPSTFWHWMMYHDDGSWRGFGQLGQNVLLLAMTFACFLASLAIFKRRDIPAPL